MANNESDNKRKPNSLMSEIASRDREFLERTAQERAARLSRESNAERSAVLEEALPGLPNDQRGAVAKLIARSYEQIDRLNPRIALYGETAQDRGINGVRSDIRGHFAGLSSGVKALSMSSVSTQAGMGMMNRPYSGLERQYEQQQAQMAALQQQSSSVAGRLYSVNESGDRLVNPNAQGLINNYAVKGERLQGQMAATAAAMRIQKQMGNDPSSLEEARIRSANTAENILGADAARQSIVNKTGYGGMSSSQLEREQVSAARALSEAFNKLHDGVEKTSKEMDALTGTIDSSEKKIKDISAVMSAGGGGGNGRLAAGLGLASGIFSAGSNVIQQLTVNQRLAQAQNATGLADIENSKYQMYKAAAGGDIASLMQLSQFSGAEGFGGELGTGARWAVRGQQGAGYLQFAAGLVKTGVSGGFVGTGDIVGGLAGSTIADADANRKVSENQARIAAIQARMDVSRAINAVGAEQVQGFRDFSVGMGATAIGMGARGEAFLNRSTSDDQMSRMAGARISPEQMVQMSSLGVASMGSMFNESMVLGARTNEQRGLGTMQENMQRMARMSGAGSNNPTAALGAITENAVTRGLDSSKALNAVVDHTAAMAAVTTGRALGIDTSAAATMLLTAGITKDTPNKEAALERSAGLQDVFNNVGTNAGANYAGMVNIARISKSTGLGGMSAILASQLSDADLMSMNKDNAAKMLSGAGVDVRGKNAPDIVTKLKEDRQMTLLETGNLSVNFNRKDTINRINAGRALTGDEEQGLAASAGFLSMRTGQKVTAQDLKNRIAGISGSVAQEPFGPANVNDASTRANLDRQRTAGFEQLSVAAGTAATNLGGASAAIVTLTKAIEGLEKMMPGTEKAATTAAGRAAGGEKGMTMDIPGFNLAIKNLNTVLNTALAKSSLGAGVTDRQRPKAPGP